MVKPQWFVKMDELAKPAIDVLKTGELNFYPERYGKTYLHWMENIRDWCISRQLWWGHRIPAYYCAECGHMVVASERPQPVSYTHLDVYKRQLAVLSGGDTVDVEIIRNRDARNVLTVSVTLDGISDASTDLPTKADS